jgi:hypothetical protein
MKHPVEIGSAATIHTSKFHEEWFWRSEVDGGGIHRPDGVVPVLN